jgi:molybdopterin-synthase adenylyltransferase
MKTFAVEAINDPDSNPFDRQERIEWWSQEKISQAKIMVVGAGAIGNETLKNLALLGVRNIFIVDFDKVSKSNLSRTVLFRKSDIDEKKAEIAAKRTKELCLAEDVRIDWFHGDLVWELGTGIYREMKLVLGCLDNVETRFHLNRQCILAQTPWIDTGIHELGLHVSFYSPSPPPCYECGMTKEQREALRKRYSCDDFKRSMYQEGKVPTVQIASSIASALQVQEAMKYICGQQVLPGKQIYFQGKMNDFDINQIPTNEYCQAHVSYSEIIRLPISSNLSLRQFLLYVSQPIFSGEKAVLDLSADRYLTISVNCRSCGKPIFLYKPPFRLFDTDTVCLKCKAKGKDLSYLSPNIIAEKKMINQFELGTTESRILDMSLREIGIPLWHILTVRDRTGNERHYELFGDREILLPNMSKIDSHV